MSELFLRVRAPFAAFRWFQAGVYRATSPVIPPSAAWGLILNLAGIDTRGVDKDGTTTVRPDAPMLEIAIGEVATSETSVLYQQLHTYPVGSAGAADLKPRTRGAKYWIAPARREILVGFDCVLGVRGDADVLERLAPGLSGELSDARYGLPHAGDNNLLLDRVEITTNLPACRWYVRVGPDALPHRRTCRLTIGIDRSNSSLTSSAIFAPTIPSRDAPPTGAWTCVPREHE